MTHSKYTKSLKRKGRGSRGSRGRGRGSRGRVRGSRSRGRKTRRIVYRRRNINAINKCHRGGAVEPWMSMYMPEKANSGAQLPTIANRGAQLQTIAEERARAPPMTTAESAADALLLHDDRNYWANQNYPIKYKGPAAERFERMEDVAILNMTFIDRTTKDPYGIRIRFIYRLDKKLIDFIIANFSKVSSLFSMVLLKQGSDNGDFQSFAKQYAITPKFEQTSDDPLFVAVGALEWTEEDVKKADEKMEKEESAAHIEFEKKQDLLVQKGLDEIESFKRKSESEIEEARQNGTFPLPYIRSVPNAQRDADIRQEEINYRDIQQRKLKVYMERRTIAQKEEDERKLAELAKEYEQSAQWIRKTISAAAERAREVAVELDTRAREVAAARNCVPCYNFDDNSYLWGTLKKKRGIGNIVKRKSELRYLRLYKDPTGWMLMYADDAAMTIDRVEIRLSSNNRGIERDIVRARMIYDGKNVILKLFYKKGKKTKGSNDFIEFYLTCLEKNSSEIKLCVRNMEFSESDNRKWIDLMIDKYKTIGSFKSRFNTTGCDQIIELWMKCLNSCCMMTEPFFDLYRSVSRHDTDKNDIEY